MPCRYLQVLAVQQLLEHGVAGAHVESWSLGNFMAAAVRFFPSKLVPGINLRKAFAVLPHVLRPHFLNEPLSGSSPREHDRRRSQPCRFQ